MSSNISNTPSPSTDTSDKPDRQSAEPALRADQVLSTDPVLRADQVLRVKHETRYDYEQAASLAYEVAWLKPRVLPEQRVLKHKLRIEPAPRFVTTQEDVFGNWRTYFEVHKSHHTLSVESEAIVVRRPSETDALKEIPWERCTYSAMEDPTVRTQLCSLAFPGPMTPLHGYIAAYAREMVSEGLSIHALITKLTESIFCDFTYVPGVTSIETTVDEVWRTNRGVCQDFAHVAIVALRSLGLVAAYVSGYLLTHPPEGQEKLVGADASHAWFAVFVPGIGWVHSDPTNNMWVGQEHITIALGRDYTDVPPLKGMCYGGGERQPEVRVSVDPITEEEVKKWV